MAIQTFQFCIVLAIGFSAASATLSAAVAKETTTPIALSLQLKDPEDVTVTRGHFAVFHCKTSTQNRQISWFYNDILVSEKDRRWKLFENGTLYVRKVTNKLEGFYKCIAQNDDGAIVSKPATLKIANVKDFIKEPEDVSLIEFQPIEIPCSINILPNSTIRWEHNDEPLPQDTRFIYLPTGSLLITSIHSSDAGSYRCIMDNLSLKDSRRSKLGLVTVRPNPKLIVPPTILPLDVNVNVTVLVGDDVTLYCIVKGWPIPTIQWLNHKNETINIASNNSNIFVLRHITLAHAGKYTCSAKNQGGHTFQVYYISVLQAPYFNFTPQSRIYPKPQTIRLECLAVGFPKPKIVWYKNGQLFHTNSTYGRANEQSNQLLISYSVVSDAGFYQCFAQNEAGMAWSAALIKLNYSNNSPKAPENVRCAPYNNTSMCLQWNKVDDAQAYSILAHHPGLRLREYLTNETHQLADNLLPKLNYTFSLRTYSKEASNEFVHISCESSTSQSRNLIVHRLNLESVKLTWSEISSDGSACGSDLINFYKVHWRKLNDNVITVLHASGLKKIVKDLQPSITYEFRVQSSTTGGDSDWVPFTILEDNTDIENSSTKNDIDTIMANETTIPNIPTNLKAITNSPYSVNLSWTGGQSGDSFYLVCYVIVNEGRDCEEGRVIKSVANKLLINNLTAGSSFEFKVRAHNADGMYSPFSFAEIFSTPSDVPSPVLGLKYKIINTTSVCIRWEPPLYKNGELSEYLIKYTPNNSWPLEKWFATSLLIAQSINDCWGSDMHTVSTVLSDLDPEQKYIAVVIALNDAGAGNPVPITLSSKYQLLVDDFHLAKAENVDDNTNRYYKHVIAVVFGLVISFCIVLVGTIFYVIARCYMKRKGRSLSPNRPCYAGNVQYSSRQENCTADVHEMQHLVEGNGTIHAPPNQRNFVDSKGGPEFPNGQINGNLKKGYFNGNLPNCQVHITENPQFSTNEYSRAKLKILSGPMPFEEDSNSNLQHFSLTRNINQDSPLPQNHNESHSSIEHSDDNSSHDNTSIDIVRNNLNCTQLTILEDSTNRLTQLTPTLGPNG